MKAGIKLLFNRFRNVLLFRFRYPWIVHGKNTHCQWNVIFNSPRRQIRMGDNVGIGYHCLFYADATIGNDVLIAPFCCFLNGDEHLYDIPGTTMWNCPNGSRLGIQIEDDVWIGCGAKILGPVTVHEGSIVAAGSVVTQDVAPYSVVGGVPAKHIKMRFSPEQIQVHKAALLKKA
jgi:acetyltransferase-like isoleucine patch superfamily enzyme